MSSTPGGISTLREHIATFFVGHYGIFWFAHGLFVLLAFPDMDLASPRVVATATVGLLAYHVVSYRLNYVGKREYERNGPVTLMVDPYRRVFVLHVTIVLG